MKGTLQVASKQDLEPMTLEEKDDEEEEEEEENSVPTSHETHCISIKAANWLMWFR
jgi:tetrahydromethanopterin S-methyltransferase subunit A